MYRDKDNESYVFRYLSIYIYVDIYSNVCDYYVYMDEIYIAKEAHKSTCGLINDVKNTGKTFGEKNTIYLLFVLNAKINSRWNELPHVKKETSKC